MRSSFLICSGHYDGMVGLAFTSVVAQPSHVIKIVDKNGVRTLKTVVTTSSELPPATPQSEGIMVQ